MNLSGLDLTLLILLLLNYWYKGIALQSLPSDSNIPMQLNVNPSAMVSGIGSSRHGSYDVIHRCMSTVHPAGLTESRSLLAHPSGHREKTRFLVELCYLSLRNVVDLGQDPPVASVQAVFPVDSPFVMIPLHDDPPPRGCGERFG